MAGKKAEKLAGDDWEKLLAEIPESYVADTSGGFAPYWTPEIGKQFHAHVSEIDDTDPNFVRFILVNISDKPLECQRGPAAGAEIVMVEPGGEFTCSEYATLNLRHYFGCRILVTVFENRKLPGNDYSEGKPRDLWEFKVHTALEDKKMLDQERADRAKEMRAKAAELRRSGLMSGGRRRRALPNGGTNGETGKSLNQPAGDAE